MIDENKWKHDLIKKCEKINFDSCSKTFDETPYEKDQKIEKCEKIDSSGYPK